jgi:hypothetical protein
VHAHGHQVATDGIVLLLLCAPSRTQEDEYEDEDEGGEWEEHEWEEVGARCLGCSWQAV